MVAGPRVRAMWGSAAGPRLVLMAAPPDLGSGQLPAGQPHKRIGQVADTAASPRSSRKRACVRRP